MTTTRFASTAALIAIVAGTAPVAAQTADQTADQTAAQGTELPALLQGLDLERLRSETKRDGQRAYEGRLPDGTEIEAEFDMAGNLIEIEADDGSLPAPVIEAALPAAMRDNPAMALFERYEEIRVRPGHIEVKGWQASGEDIEVKFAPDNRLIEIEADDATLPQPIIDAILPQTVRGSEVIAQFATIDEIKAEYGRFEVRGEDAGGEDMRAQFDEAGTVLRFTRAGEGRDGDHRRDDRGPRGDDHRGDGPRGDGPRGDGPRGDGPRGNGPRADGPAAPQFDTVEANQRLSQAGYTALGLLRQDGPRVLLDATNPQGEAVTLELDPRGQLVRETAR